MKIRNLYLFALGSFAVLLTACSTQTMIVSSNIDQIVIRAKPSNFTEAFHMAQKECQKNTRNAQYLPDQSEDITRVTFDCIDPFAGTEAEEETAEAVSETSDEDISEDVMEEDELPEEEIPETMEEDDLPEEEIPAEEDELPEPAETEITPEETPEE